MMSMSWLSKFKAVFRVNSKASRKRLAGGVAVFGGGGFSEGGGGGAFG